MQAVNAVQARALQADPNRPRCTQAGCTSLCEPTSNSTKEAPKYRNVCRMHRRPNTGKNFNDHRKHLRGLVTVDCEACGKTCKVTSSDLSQVIYVDHIDGNHFNNVPENFAHYCRDCHTKKTIASGDHIEYTKRGLRPRAELQAEYKEKRRIERELKRLAKVK